MDCSQLVSGGGLAVDVFLCRVQVILAQLSTWVHVHPLLAVFAALVVLLLSARLRRFMVRVWLGIVTTFPTRHARRIAAERRSEGLLRENLTSVQYRQLATIGYLDVPSRLYPRRCYRIPRKPGRTKVLEAGQKIMELCVISRDPAPSGDLILAQKWMIEADEQAYLRIANQIGGSSM